MAFKRFNAKPSSTITSSDSTALPLKILNWILRFLQLVFAVAVIGLYAQDLKKAHKEDKYTDSKWAYAVAVATIAAVTAILYSVPRIPWHWTFGWDTVLFILWAAVFGIFGKLYIHANPQGDGGILRMKNAVWVDLVNMLLWLVTAVMGVVVFFMMRGNRSLHTGRAAV